MHLSRIGITLIGFATCSSTGSSAALAASSVVAPSGYTVSVFATGTAGNTRPDAIFMQGGYVYVAFQNSTTATGGGGNSTIVQYDASGKVVRSVQVPGRCDGMRWNPYTHLVWITVNEDANSALFTWQPSSNALKRYTFSAATHQGGYDDLAFINGMAFVVASHPTLTPQGTNTAPAVVRVDLDGTTAKVTPVLNGNQTAVDVTSGATVTLNLNDPDSLTVDPAGDLVVVAQADKQLVRVHDPGRAGQSVSRVMVTTQLDDTVWSTDANGTLYVVDQMTNTIYTVRGPLNPATVYTETPNHSSVPGMIGTVDMKSGTVTPLITGFSSPTGLIFVTDREMKDRSG